MDISEFNDKQKEAILDFDHNLMILACAGSGKTKTITGKIAYAIANGIYDPRNICAVTFTNKAANEMRERLETLVPGIARRATIRTFHSLGMLLLRRFGKQIGISKNFMIADDSDVVHIMIKALGQKSKEGQNIAKSIAKDVLNAKEHGCDEYSDENEAKKYFPTGTSKLDGDAKHYSWDQLMHAYERQKREENMLDFPDLIARCVEMLELCDDARFWCHDRYRMILVDEYQDSNYMQAKFLKLFAGRDSRIVVVGDDDQSIYAFRGAVVDNILNFPKQFSNVREIRLEKNYRSTKEILAAAGNIVKRNMKRYPKEIASAIGKTGAIPRIITSDNPYAEASWVADMIQHGGLGSVAILYRQHRMVEVMKRVFNDRKIPFREAGGQGVYGSAYVKVAMSMLSLCLNRSDRNSLRKVMIATRLGLGTKAFEKIDEMGMDIYIASRMVADMNPRYRKGLITFVTGMEELEDRLCGTVDKKISWKTEPPKPQKKNDEPMLFDMDSVEQPPEPPEEYINETGYDGLTDGQLLVKVMKDFGIVKVQNDNKSDDETFDDDEDGVDQKLNYLETFSAMLDEREKFFDPELIGIEDDLEPTKTELLMSFMARSALGAEVENEDEKVVTLSTMHASKGLEWDTVFCIGAEDEVIPGKFETNQELEEERRIFYVALTRARTQLYICHREKDPAMKWCDPTPSRFIDEIPRSMKIIGKDGLFQSKPRDKSKIVKNLTPIEIGDCVELQKQWQGIVVGEGNKRGFRTLVIKTDSGKIMNMIYGVAPLKVLDDDDMKTVELRKKLQT